MARKNQIANGSALKIPATPNGRNGPPPPASNADSPSQSFGMFVQKLESNLPEKIVARKKKMSTAIESTVIVTVNRIVASIPTMLIHTKMT